MSAEPGTAEEKKAAWISALRLLAASSKSSAQLKERLEEKGFSGPVVSDVLKMLEEKALISDRRLAEAVVHKFRTVRPAGKLRIVAELRRKKISPEKTREVLGEISSEDEGERAYLLAVKKAAELKKRAKNRPREKLFYFLQTRGFDSTASKAAVDRVFRESM